MGDDADGWSTNVAPDTLADSADRICDRARAWLVWPLHRHYESAWFTSFLWPER